MYFDQLSNLVLLTKFSLTPQKYHNGGIPDYNIYIYISIFEKVFHLYEKNNRAKKFVWISHLEIYQLNYINPKGHIILLKNINIRV